MVAVRYSCEAYCTTFRAVEHLAKNKITVAAHFIYSKAPRQSVFLPGICFGRKVTCRLSTASNTTVAHPASGFGALHRDLLHKLEQTSNLSARDRHLVKDTGIKLVLQARRSPGST